MRVDVQYVDFDPIKVNDEFKDNVSKYKVTFSDEKNWLFTIDNKVKQKYLMPLSNELGKYISSLVNPPQIDKDDDATDDSDDNPIKGQGHADKFKKYIEQHAMRVVKEIFENKGYNVEDVSNVKAKRGERGPGYDFICIKSNKDIVYCEVKGTRGSMGRDDYVFITENEYFKSNEYGDKSALYIVYNIKIDEKSKPPRAFGGEIKILHPWNPKDPNNCHPYTYKFFPDKHN